MTEKPLAAVEDALIDLKAIIKLCLRAHEATDKHELHELADDMTAIYYIMLDKVQYAETSTHALYSAHHRNHVAQSMASASVSNCV